MHYLSIPYFVLSYSLTCLFFINALFIYRHYTSYKMYVRFLTNKYRMFFIFHKILYSLPIIRGSGINEKKKQLSLIVKNIENIYFGIHIQVHYTLWICPLDLNTYISVQPEKGGSKLVLESCL